MVNALLLHHLHRHQKAHLEEEAQLHLQSYTMQFQIQQSFLRHPLLTPIAANKVAAMVTVRFITLNNLQLAHHLML
jgi:hypothetical protein